MNKKELVEFIFERLGKKISKKIINDVSTAFMDGILHSVSTGEPIKLVGFVNITLRHYGERTARNPKTGVISKTAPTVKAFAKLGTLFKDAVKKITPVVPKESKTKPAPKKK